MLFFSVLQVKTVLPAPDCHSNAVVNLEINVLGDVLQSFIFLPELVKIIVARLPQHCQVNHTSLTISAVQNIALQS